MAENDLIIDPGHGGTDPGAVKGEYEKDWALKISLYQYERFKQLGVKVSLTRSTDKTLDSGPRTTAVKASKATYCISNHLNAGGGDRGEVIHSIHDNGQLANAIKAHLIAAGQTSVKVYCRESTKVKGKDYYYMHRETGAVKTNIVEYCFIDNAADFAHFKANWKEYAEAVVKAFCSFTDTPYKAPVVPKPVKPAPAKPAADTDIMYRVVTGSFADRKNAEERITDLKAKGFDSFIDLYEK